MQRDRFNQVHVRQETNNRSTFILASLLILATTISTSFTVTGECKRLEDGKYKVKFKRFPESNFILRIERNQFTKMDKKGQVTKGTIEWGGDCYFTLSSDTVTFDNPVAKKIKLGLGNPTYELTKARGRVKSFTHHFVLQGPAELIAQELHTPGVSYCHGYAAPIRKGVPHDPDIAGRQHTGTRYASQFARIN